MLKVTIYLLGNEYRDKVHNYTRIYGEQLEECIEMIGEDISTSVTSPETNKLFEVREDCEQLSDKNGKLFHSVVANLLFIMKRSGTDLDMAVGFLTMRVLRIDI